MVVNNKPVLARRGLWNDKRTTNMALLRWRNHANYALSKHAWFFNRMPPSNMFGRLGVQLPSGRVGVMGVSRMPVSSISTIWYQEISRQRGRAARTVREYILPSGRASSAVGAGGGRVQVGVEAASALTGPTALLEPGRHVKIGRAHV